MKGRVSLLVVAALIVGVGGGIWLRSSGVVGPRVQEAPPLPPPVTPEGTNGLTWADRGTYYHLSEGGELFPLDWFLALEVETMDSDGTILARPFMANIERFGLLPDPKSAGNPYGVPVGISVGRSKLFGTEMIGINCAACHVGQWEYRGRAVRIDGGPNMSVVNDFINAMVGEATATFKSPRRLARFWNRVRAQRRERRAAAGGVDPAAPEESFVRRMLELVTQNRDLLDKQIATIRYAPALQRAIAVGVPVGPGRLDAFGVGRDELLGAIPGNTLPPDGPVSLPHMWGLAYTGWLQWGANTNSVMERNIGQALGVGALFDMTTYESTVKIHNLHKLEAYAYRMQPPAWPEFFPAIDRARADRGQKLFGEFCAGCHEQWDSDGLMRSYNLFALDEVRTDPLVAIGFERPVKLPTGEITPFAYAAGPLLRAVKERAYADLGLSPEEIAKLEQRHLRKGPQWDPVVRATLLDSEKWPDSKGRKVYRAKTLVGIWATPPFLHNGSVPTVFDLLKPATERPVMFPTGQREFDPVKLGIQTDPARYSQPQGLTPFQLDTRIGGNWNTGHEWSFYPKLTDDMRFDIIEYLKTHNDPFPHPPAATAAELAEAAASIPPVRPTPPSGRGRLRLSTATWLGLGGLMGMGLLGLLVIRSVSANAARFSADEAADTQFITDGIVALQGRLAAAQDRPRRRGTHAKGRGCRATFEVYDLEKMYGSRNGLGVRLAQGLFATPGVYQATVRFANGNPQIQRDQSPDARACSFSVDVPAGVVSPAAVRQDFALNDAPIFPFNDAHAFAVFLKAALAPNLLRGFLSLRLADKMVFLRILGLVIVTSKRARAAFQQTRYWSTVPFAHGQSEVVKYSATPCAANPAHPLDRSPNALQNEIVRHVTDDEHMSAFDFGIQLLEVDAMKRFGRRRDGSYWIENASIPWKESQSPFYIVGRLTLVRGSAMSEEECEAQYIDVTEHSTPASTPLGSINRARGEGEAASRRARGVR